ncbi:MAG TPA: hypothetical protein VL137_09335 [Polyangiaceae bacterium]|nr:hypothetical protein [Polyangiaceae bacterium]
MSRVRWRVVTLIVVINGSAWAQERWASPIGMTGAGLGMTLGQSGRAWTELGLFSGNRRTEFSLLGGLGMQVKPDLELELVLPMSHIALDPAASDFMIGNPYAALSYLSEREALRFKIGGGVALPLVRAGDVAEYANALTAAAMDGFQNSFLWTSRTMSLVAPMRLETGQVPIFSLDGAPIVGLPTGKGGDMELSVQLAPGASVYVGYSTLVGARLPLYWIPTQSGDDASVALEPFVRHEIDSIFLNARLTLNLDKPLGFAFDRDGFWGLHLGGGGTF